MKQTTDDQLDNHLHPDDEPDKALERLEEIWDRQIMKGDDAFDRVDDSNDEPDKVLDKLEAIWDRQTMRGDEDPLDYRDFSKSDQGRKIDPEERGETKRVRRRRRPMM